MNQDEEDLEDDEDNMEMLCLRRNTFWMDLIEVNSHLNESDQIKGILCNVLNP